ncbi:MAG: hypothetical protein FJX45_17760 [Alphaproteobacteria bacterium]|nr:hypothetical protein [Alphaproteobacteria bacterium]
MTSLEQVSAFIVARAPRATCDECIAQNLGFSNRQHANERTRKLERKPGFDRRRQTCSICGKARKAIGFARES